MTPLDLDDRQTWFAPLKHLSDLVFIHLSDIHFRASEKGAADRNADLRNEILLDLRRQMTHLHRYDGILVTGDIAFAGREDEFRIARRWLDVLCEHLEVDTRNVLVTPGNHDVDRTLADRPEVSALRSQIRAAEGERLQAELTAAVTDPNSRLFEPIAEFNNFARPFGCDVLPDRPFWERRFALNDGSYLCVRGMTSTWVSGTGDNVNSHRMALGGIQCALQREDGLEYLTMAHHPPSWLLDHDEVSRYLNTRARVQLYGHKHEQWIENLGYGIRIVAGAVHPERAESKWVPRYNVLTLSLRKEQERRSLDVIVYPRRWSEEETCFIPDCNREMLPVRLCTFDLDPWAPPAAGGSGRQGPIPGAAGSPLLRDIYYRLTKLPVDLRRRIPEVLGLAVGGNVPPDSTGFDEELIAVAAAANKLDELRAMVDGYHGELNRSRGSIES